MSISNNVGNYRTGRYISNYSTSKNVKNKLSNNMNIEETSVDREVKK